MMNQRWDNRRAKWRDGAIDPREFEVVEIDSDSAARAFVEQHHYSATYPAARFRFELRRRGALVGMAVYSHPCRNDVLTNALPWIDDPMEGVELGRFVLLDEVAGNGESWFLARTFEMLRGRVRGVVSFSDPIPRTTDRGALVMPGHIGMIYQASNAHYGGRGTARTLALMPDGRVLSDRAIAKIRAAHRGWRAAVDALVERWDLPQLAEGATRAERRAWLATVRDRLVRPLRHPGNYRYTFRLERAPRSYDVRRPYPKREAA